MSSLKKKFFALSLIAFSFLAFVITPCFVQAASFERSFFVNSNYDFSSSEMIDAQLLKTTNKIYFYVQKDWYQNLDPLLKNQLNNKLSEIANIFENQFYPKITNLLTTEDLPGIDNDSRLIVVLEKLKNDFGGYVRTNDHLPKSISPDSNEGQIVFLNAEALLTNPSSVSSYYLTHEFTHLITLKAKPEMEVFLSEMLAESSAFFLDPDVSRSLLLKRANQLLSTTSLNFNLWQEKSFDYAKVHFLSLYLKEQFGEEIFKDILFSSKNGFLAIEEAVQKRNPSLDLDDLMIDFLITLVLNDCSVNKKYCFTDQSLTNFSVLPYSYYLPTKGQVAMTVTDSISKMEGKWQKITGGNGLLKLKFILPEGTPIKKIPYILIDSNNQKTLNFLDFSRTNIQEITVLNFGSQYQSLIFIPYLGKEAKDNQSYYYAWEVKILPQSEVSEEQVKTELLKQIADLKRQVAVLQERLAYLLTVKQQPICSNFNSDLSYGMTSNEVKCLQQFLANLGEDIYPEKLVTGYYGPLTEAAVKRYQGLKGIMATGYFGPLTRAVANQQIRIP